MKKCFQARRQTGQSLTDFGLILMVIMLFSVLAIQHLQQDFGKPFRADAQAIFGGKPLS